MPPKKIIASTSPTRVKDGRKQKSLRPGKKKKRKQQILEQVLEDDLSAQPTIEVYTPPPITIVCVSVSLSS